MIDRKMFYSKVRTHFGKLLKSQVLGFEAILDLWDVDGYTDLRWLAYMFATSWHETARTMQPVREYGSRKYFNKYEPGTRLGKALGNTQPGDGYRFRGGGFPQLTGRDNYTKMTRILGVDLVNHPELIENVTIAVEVMFEGMLTRRSFKGDFTGKSLENYFNKKVDDPIGARRIINGTDKAWLIAGYHRKFLSALQSAKAVPLMAA